MFLNGFDMGDTYYEENYPYTQSFVEYVLTGIVHETDKAYLLRRPHGKFWVPKALCGRVCESRAEIADTFKIKYIKDNFRGSLRGDNGRT